MKKALLLALVAFSLVSYAQDKVVLKSGDTLNVQVTKSTDTAIEFTYPNETLVNEKRKKEYAENRRKAHLISEALAAGNYEMPISTEQQQDMAADDIVKRFYNDTEHEVSVYNSDTIDDLEEMNLNGRT